MFFMEWWNNLEWNILGAAAEEANFSMSAAVVKSCKIHRRRCPFRDTKGGGGISNRGGQANKFLAVCFVIIAMQYFPQT